MANLKVIALDPGRTTGYAYGEKYRNDLKISYYQAEWDHLNLYGFLEDSPHDYIVCESFEFRQGKQTGVDLYPCELIGVVNYFDQRVNVQSRLYMQTAAQGKGYYDNDKLKAMDLYKRGLQHGRDACRHLLYWFYFGSGFRFIEDDDVIPYLGRGW